MSGAFSGFVSLVKAGKKILVDYIGMWQYRESLMIYLLLWVLRRLIISSGDMLSSAFIFHGFS